MTVVTLAPQVTCSDFACLNAISDPSACTCLCGSADHGHAWKATRQAARDRITARVETTRSASLGAAAACFEDEEW